jgi:UDP:flavonoid glycosyltransferase YjiC (YdhE family)
LVRVLITTTPGLGHFHPLVPLARGLISAGHQVLVASPVGLRAAVEDTGLPFAAIGTMERPHDLLERIRDDGGDPRQRRRNELALWWVGYRARTTVHDVLRLIDGWSPNVILRDAYDLGSQLAAERRDIPDAAAGPVLFQPPWLLEATVEALAVLRADLGLPPDPTGAALGRYLVLASFPPSWVAPDDVVPPTVRFMRPQPFAAPAGAALPGSVARLPTDHPTVHASLGTRLTDTERVIEMILAGLRDEPLNLVLTIGRQRDPAEFGPQPASVVIERYIPHELLLPRCATMLTHCGLNSIMACLTLGLPMVGVPIDTDQPRNAARLADLGAAVVVEPADRSPEAFRAATWDVLTNPTYRAGAQRLRDEIAALPGPDHAVDLLERLAQERQPLVADG